MVEMYKPYANRRDSYDREFGKGMLDLIDVLRSDPEIKNLTLGSKMNWLGLSVPDATEFKIVFIQWAWTSADTYDIFLEPFDYNESPTVTKVTIIKVVDMVKELLELPRIKRDQA
jgi:hypothetical protein